MPAGTVTDWVPWPCEVMCSVIVWVLPAIVNSMVSVVCTG